MRSSTPFARSWRLAGSPARALRARTSRQRSPRSAARRTRSPSTTARRRSTSRCSPSGIGPGDEVIVADYTFPATGHAVLFTGARPGLRRRRPDTWCVDPTPSRPPSSAREPWVSSPSTSSASAPTTTELRSHHGRARPVPRRGRGVLRRRDLPGRPAGIPPRRRRVLQPARPQGHHLRRGRRRDHRRREHRTRVRKPSAFGIESALSRAGRDRAADPGVRRARATTTSSPTSPRRSLASSSTGSPICSRRGRVRRAYGSCSPTATS